MISTQNCSFAATHQHNISFTATSFLSLLFHESMSGDPISIPGSVVHFLHTNTLNFTYLSVKGININVKG